MPEVAPILLFVVIIGVVILVGALGWLQEKRRREAFQALASRLGLRYSAKDWGIANSYAFLDKLREGSRRYAFNILDGNYNGHDVLVFDYHYETYSTDSKGHRDTHHHYFSFFVLNQMQRFPELRIYPENVLSKLGQMLGFDDIDFESIEFSRAFTVRSKDRKFAYDFCHPRMMEYLLKDRRLCLEIEEHALSMSFDRRLNVDEIQSRLDQLVDIRTLIPEYLYRSDS